MARVGFVLCACLGVLNLSRSGAFITPPGTGVSRKCNFKGSLNHCAPLRLAKGFGNARQPGGRNSKKGPPNPGGIRDEDLERRLNDSAQQMDALLCALEARWHSLPSLEQKVGAVAATLEELDRKKFLFAISEALRPELSRRLVQLTAPIANFAELLTRHRESQRGASGLGSWLDGEPLREVRCASVDPGLTQYCTNEATLVCPTCRLVAYCSPGCQAAHRRAHSRDCKSPLASVDWQPGYLLRRRPPAFVGNAIGGRAKEHLFGNTPAYDLLRGLDLSTSDGEGDEEGGIHAVFAASGDLRMVVQTLSSLCENDNEYEGAPLLLRRPLHVYVNDWNPRVALRNYLLLRLLLTHGEEGVDAVVGLWYSAILTSEQRMAGLSTLAEVVKDLNQEAMGKDVDSPTLSFASTKGPTTLEADFSAPLLSALQDMTTLDPSHDMNVVTDVRQGVTLSDDPYETDLRERFLFGLEGHHRESWMEYARFGMLLPFGGLNAHHNAVNPWLWHTARGWALSPSDNPWEGWPMADVLGQGAARGVPGSDVSGALFLHVAGQLRACVRSLQRRRVHLHVSCTDAASLAEGLLSTHHLAGRVQRVDVSNILDRSYAGLRGALAPWARLLKPGEGRVVGYSMNWASLVKGLDAQAVKAQVDAAMADRAAGLSPRQLARRTHDAMFAPSFADLDTSPAFREYLAQEGLAGVESELGLRLALDEHVIVPPRLGVDVSAKWDAMPPTDGRARYILGKLQGSAMQERYVEFVRSA